MTVRFSTSFRNIGSVDLKRNSRVRFDKILQPEEPVPQGHFKAQVPIEMLMSEIFDDTFDVQYNSTGVYYDPADYDGVQNVWFQSTLENNAFPGDTRFLDLVDENGVLYSTVSVTQGFPGMYTRVRAAFVPANIPHLYCLKTRAAPGGDSFEMDTYDGKILVDQDNATLTKVHVPMIAGDISTGGGAVDAAGDDQQLWCGQGAQAAYDYISGALFAPIPEWHQIFLLEKAKWQTVINWELEVNANTSYGNPGTGNGKAALFNLTTGLMVTGSELSWAANTPPVNKRIQWANNAVNFTDLDEFVVLFKTDTPHDFQGAIQPQLASLNVRLSLP
jgi:hypothetical protein